MEEIKDNTNRWRAIPCSWRGRINTVKMTILLKAICSFNATPNKLPMALSTELEQKNFQFCFLLTMWELFPVLPSLDYKQQQCQSANPLWNSPKYPAPPLVLQLPRNDLELNCPIRGHSMPMCKSAFQVHCLESAGAQQRSQRQVEGIFLYSQVRVQRG